MLLCEFVEGLVRMAHIAYPSERNRVSDSFHELLESNLVPLLRKSELIGVEKPQHDWDALKEFLLPSMHVVKETFIYFSSLDQQDAEGDSMNVNEFMSMIDDLQLCDQHLTLSKCIEIFVENASFTRSLLTPRRSTVPGSTSRGSPGSRRTRSCCCATSGRTYRPIGETERGR